ncbi:PREDICTED: FYVE, RhoGEF and PH domain-containing protein 6-like [Cyprinodon variegatus]|uniref:FYVE, RhoGEF and PH domain-containing protein 6-like n=1 Tax=Cyprinodon variegatus TaxID=28743 RepID=UPI00074250D7|nr:PREDICTED: FYVE, RhoGEF and PH domain-containing protein 6-like [Cyprinodon variegatus]
MNPGMDKPPIAPKPKFISNQRPVRSPLVPRRDGLSRLSPGTPKKVKPAIAPKPILSKFPTPLESRPPILKQQKPPNGFPQNKKPEWDYIIPICLCAQENCTCMNKTKLEQREKDFEAPQRSKMVQNKNTPSIPKDNIQVMNNTSNNGRIINYEKFNKTQSHKTDSDTFSDEKPVGPSQRTLRQDVPGTGQQGVSLGSERTSVQPPKRPPPGLRKPHPVPVPRKPRTNAPFSQEKVERDRDETAIQESMEVSLQEVEMSSDGKGWSSPSVSIPDNKNRAVIQSARQACPPPVPPSRKKPLSNPLKAPLSTTPAPFEDMYSEDLGRSNSIHEMELCVDSGLEVLPKKVVDNQEDRDQLPLDASLSPPIPKDVPKMFVKAEDRGIKNKTPRKLLRNNSTLGFHEDKGLKKLENFEARQANIVKDGKSKELMKRELPLPPHLKSDNKPAKPESLHPSRTSLNKKKSKSFSSADLIHSDGQKGKAFRKILELKLHKKTLQKKTTTANYSISHPHREEFTHPSSPDHMGIDDNIRYSQAGVEQSVDGDEIYQEPPLSPIYHTIPLHFDSPDYENIDFGKPVSPYPVFDPEGWQSPQNDDEGIYEEHDPYFSLVKEQQHLTPTGYKRNLADEEDIFNHETLSDDEFDVNSSDEDDSSFNSCKEDFEHPEIGLENGKQKTKIEHIATEIMTSESVFVDVLKLLHVDFREAVQKASQQNGKPVIEERILNQILYSLPQLYELNQDLLKELEQKVAHWDESSQVADLFLKKGHYLKMYSTYIREFNKNVNLLEEQTKKNSAFAAVVREFETSPRCANLAIKHYLLKPVQRIPQYQLLLTDYLKNLSEDSDDYKDTEAALALLKEVATHANDIMKHGDNLEKLIQVQNRLSGHHVIIQPGRVFIKEGFLMKLSRKVMQPRMFFLLSDVLLYTTPVQSGQFKLKNMLSLSGMKVSKPSQEAYQNELNIESVERSFILSASSAAERDEWLTTISSAISEYTKRKISFMSTNTPAQGRTSTGVVCQSCSSNKHCLAYLKNQSARVCDQCFLILQQQKSDVVSSAAMTPGSRATIGFSRKQKKIPAALKEVSANTDDSSMSGYLHRSKHNKKHWKRLWFVIKDKVLYTYAASEDVAASESQPLLGFVLKVDSSEKQQFKLYHKNTLYYIFRADDAQTAQRWIDSFREAIVL